MTSKAPTLINKDEKCNQTIYNDWYLWINNNIPGTSFAERVEVLCRNWIDTKDRAYTEIWWNDMAGKSELYKKLEELEKKVGEI
jgi:hypothetical protein